MDPLRSSGAWLYVPATRPDRFAGAAASGAERVVIDLEDTVPPAEKRAAARALRDAVLPPGVPVYLRVNGPETEWHVGDLAIAACLPIAGIVLPRAEAADRVLRAAHALPDRHQIVPIVETAAGVWNVLEVARTPRVERLALGALDLQLDTGMQEGGAGVLFARAQLVLASRFARIAPPLDAVTLAVEDKVAVATAARQARRDGFGGKLCVHPRQVEAVRRAFAPDAGELEWAEAVLRAAADRGAGDHDPFLFRGALVDRPVLDRALRTVQRRG